MNIPDLIKKIEGILVLLDDVIIDQESVSVVRLDELQTTHLERARLRATTIRRELDSLLYELEVQKEKAVGIS